MSLHLARAKSARPRRTGKTLKIFVRKTARRSVWGRRGRGGKGGAKSVRNKETGAPTFGISSPKSEDLGIMKVFGDFLGNLGLIGGFRNLGRGRGLKKYSRENFADFQKKNSWIF